MKPTILKIYDESEASKQIQNKGHESNTVKLRNELGDCNEVHEDKLETTSKGDDDLEYEVVVGKQEEVFLKMKKVLTRPGGLMAIPTETVYGLAGNIYLEESLKRIFKIKNRPYNDPLIVHVESFMFALKELYDVNLYEALLILYLSNMFTPGPLTIVARCKERVSSLITNNTKYIAVRCPSNELALSLIKYVNVPLAAPSANKFGHISPTCPEHVISEFSGENLHILDGGQCKIGIESTVVKITTENEPDDKWVKIEETSKKETVINRKTGSKNGDSDSKLYMEEKQHQKRMVNEDKRGVDKRVDTNNMDVINRIYSSLSEAVAQKGKNMTSEDIFGKTQMDVNDEVMDVFKMLSGYKMCKVKVEILRKGAVTYEQIREALIGFENVNVCEYVQNNKYVGTNDKGNSKRNSGHFKDNDVECFVNVKKNKFNTDDCADGNGNGNYKGGHGHVDINRKYEVGNRDNDVDRYDKIVYDKDVKYEAPGMSITHYAPNVPTYLVSVVIDDETMDVSNEEQEENINGDMTNINAYGTENINIDEDGDYVKPEAEVKSRKVAKDADGLGGRVECKDIVMIDIGHKFKRFSSLFKAYIPVDNEPSSVANQLYSMLRRAESHALSGSRYEDTNGDTQSQSIIAIYFREKNAQLYSAIHDRLTRSTSGKSMCVHILNSEVEFLVP